MSAAGEADPVSMPLTHQGRAPPFRSSARPATSPGGGRPNGPGASCPASTSKARQNRPPPGRADRHGEHQTGGATSRLTHHGTRCSPDGSARPRRSLPGQGAYPCPSGRAPAAIPLPGLHFSGISWSHAHRPSDPVAAVCVAVPDGGADHRYRAQRAGAVRGRRYRAGTLVGDWRKKGLQMVAIGLGAAAVGFMIGRLFHTAGG
jgi:hypothetical protein